MDSQTHIELSLRLLTNAGAPPALAVTSLFPQIDRHPPTLHRLWAHTVFRAREITDLGVRALLGGALTPTEASSFAGRRFHDEGARILKYLDRVGVVPAAATAADADWALCSFVSHLYLDAYNQPTQTFAPLSVYPAGQWDLWARLGDFRLKLYTTPVIDHLRAELFAWPLWAQQPSVGPAALTIAMMRRLRRLTLVDTSDEPARRAAGVMNLSASPAAVSLAEAFLVAFEHNLNELHEKHLAGPVPVAPPAPRVVAAL